MKKIAFTLFIALVGGIIAVGAYKLFESKHFDKLTFEERQEAHFANNPLGVVSSAGNPDFTQAAAAVSPAVVHIVTTYESKASQRGLGGGSPFDMFEEFFGRPQGRQQRSQPSRASGSGVIISSDGYIVTNNHVIEDASTIKVELTDKRTFDAKLIGRDPSTDLALIKVTAKNLPIVKFGKSDDVQIGEWVLAVGYPLGLQSTVTAGIVSATGRHLGLLDQSQQQRRFQDPNEPQVSTAIESFIQTDAVINKGNSGGALVNSSGELIGINTAIASPSGFYAGYGFAIPVDLVKKISDDFKEFGKVKRGFIGVTFTELNASVAKELDVKEINGLYVQSVVENGGAEKAGLKKGDIITKIDGRDIKHSSLLQETVARLHPGDKIKLTFKRDGKERTVSVSLQDEESINANRSSVDAKSTAQLYNKLGAGFVPLSDAKKKEMNISSGIVLSDIRRGGLFDLYDVPRGLIITKINGIEVNTVDQVESALGNSKNNMLRIEGITTDGRFMQLSFPIE